MATSYKRGFTLIELLVVFAIVPAPNPPTVLQIVASASSACNAPAMGHSKWCNGNTFLDAFATALTPNTRSPSGLPAVDVDLCSEDEDDGVPTFSSVTSRSHHPGGVNVLFGDFGVRFIKDSIQWTPWRALGTVAGGEVVSSDSY